MLEKASHLAGTKRTKTSSLFTHAWKKHPRGYPMLAERIAVKPETGIYRRFDALNARHLLYLQAELCILERQLQKQEKLDSHDRCEKRMKFATDYQRMLERPSDEENTQLLLIEKMHQKLNNYSKQGKTGTGATMFVDVEMIQIKHSYSCPFSINWKVRTVSIWTISSGSWPARTLSLTFLQGRTQAHGGYRNSRTTTHPTLSGSVSAEKRTTFPASFQRMLYISSSAASVI